MPITIIYSVNFGNGDCSEDYTYEYSGRYEKKIDSTVKKFKQRVRKEVKEQKDKRGFILGEMDKLYRELLAIIDAITEDVYDKIIEKTEENIDDWDDPLWIEYDEVTEEFIDRSKISLNLKIDYDFVFKLVASSLEDLLENAEGKSSKS